MQTGDGVWWTYPGFEKRFGTFREVKLYAWFSWTHHGVKQKDKIESRESRSGWGVHRSSLLCASPLKRPSRRRLVPPFAEAPTLYSYCVHLLRVKPHGGAVNPHGVVCDAMCISLHCAFVPDIFTHVVVLNFQTHMFGHPWGLPLWCAPSCDVHCHFLRIFVDEA